MIIMQRFNRTKALTQLREKDDDTERQTRRLDMNRILEGMVRLTLGSKGTLYTAAGKELM